MAIPDYQTVMLPLLRFVARKGETSTPEATAALAVEFGLSEDELRELIRPPCEGIGRVAVSGGEAARGPRWPGGATKRSTSTLL